MLTYGHNEQKRKAKYIYLTAAFDAAIWGAEFVLGENMKEYM